MRWAPEARVGLRCVPGLLLLLGRLSAAAWWMLPMLSDVAAPVTSQGSVLQLFGETGAGRVTGRCGAALPRTRHARACPGASTSLVPAPRDGLALVGVTALQAGFDERFRAGIAPRP